MNILFASIEDLNDWIEPLGGHPQVKTPNLARLAARGLVFTQAYAPVPACSPSRTATLFGQQPWQTGVYSNAEKWPDAYPAGQRLSLPGVMRDAGFHTVGAGKIFHLDVRGYDPQDWDVYAGDIHHKRFERISRAVRDKALPMGSDFGPVASQQGDFDARNTNWICRKIAPGLDNQFWGFGLYRPHLPFIVPQAYFDLYPPVVDPPPGLKGRAFRAGDKSELEGLPPESATFVNRRLGWILQRFGEYNDFVRAYLASISYADAMLGKVLDRLEATGQIDNTLIVLWSDHGWQFGEKLAFRKFTLWERALRVPLIVAGPGVRQGREDTPVSLLDLFPTLCARTGAQPKHPLSGVDLSPLLEGSGGIGRDHVLSVWGDWPEAGEGNMAFSLRSAAHRYTVYWEGGEELYDSAADPFEHDNLMLRGGQNVQAVAAHYRDQLNAEITDIAPRRAAARPPGR